MFISSVASSDTRFKTITLRDGLNILVADRTAESVQGDSRNSVGKTSLVLILRYLLGGDLPSAFKKAAELSQHSFTGVFHFPSVAGVAEDSVTATRSVGQPTKIHVSGWSVLGEDQEVSVAQWKILLSRYLFHIPEQATRPTSAQLWSQLIRTRFNEPTKVTPSEPDWESGVRIGHLLGLSAEILTKAGDVQLLAKQKQSLQKAIKEGAISSISLDEAQLRAQLANARRKRDHIDKSLRGYRVDEQYVEHQREADGLTAQIQHLNDEGLALQSRVRELNAALLDEVDPAEDAALKDKLTRSYRELGIVLPDLVVRRFDEVSEFHSSVVRNRRDFLQQELELAKARLAEIARVRAAHDGQRGQIMRLLTETVALDTFLSMQRDLGQLEADVADLERRLEAAMSISEIGDRVKLKTAEAVTSVRAEFHERSASLDEAISLFGELGAEIYSDRETTLLVDPTDKGILKLTPRVAGDNSTGVRSVEIFMFDLVCLISGIKNGRAPRILVHDSNLFDAVDGRQTASCLNIGARLAELYGFQYVVTMNSDALDAVVSQSEGAFDSDPYLLPTRLTDATASGGLFGLRFD